MKYFLSMLVALVFFSCEKKDATHENEIKLFQYELNREFADAATSPLTEEGLKTFKALEFFDIDENYNIEADFELTPGTPIFEMQTTTDRLPLYRKYGIAHFTLNGKKMALSIYQSQELMITVEYAEHLFLPFNDATNGTLTYGGGRFIDLEIPKEGSKTIRIDFNKAYNPYCAYNHTFSCPIPPSENNLPVAIPVGVKAYK
ncbi:MAG: hypothetical protein A3F91_04245 [Flavobacteria bacterium RIFCSPLOWO2_12_FULL_35_11]|nr:MAG: hypothetical protein A3F91_04245 [Flavobacteria bacterium RIFCSPLOWO2_12_FULL_35_11]